MSWATASSSSLLASVTSSPAYGSSNEVRLCCADVLLPFLSEQKNSQGEDPRTSKAQTARVRDPLFLSCGFGLSLVWS